MGSIMTPLSTIRREVRTILNVDGLAFKLVEVLVDVTRNRVDHVLDDFLEGHARVFLVEPDDRLALTVIEPVL